MENETEFGTVKILGRDKDASYTVETVFSGKKIPKHYHKERDETVLVIKGNASKLKEGEKYFFRKGEPHEFENDSNVFLKLLLIAKPPYDEKDYYV